MKLEAIHNLQCKRLSQDAILPTRAHPNDAGLDLYGTEEAVIEPSEGRLLSTGIAVALPDGHVGMIADRSSLAKKGLKTAGGIIDSGYRGEIKIVIWNLSKTPIKLGRGERIAQMLVLPIATPAPVETQELDTTARGAGGFGSTGQ